MSYLLECIPQKGGNFSLLSLLLHPGSLELCLKSKNFNYL